MSPFHLYYAISLYFPLPLVARIISFAAFPFPLSPLRPLLYLLQLCFDVLSPRDTRALALFPFTQHRLSALNKAPRATEHVLELGRLAVHAQRGQVRIALEHEYLVRCGRSGHEDRVGQRSRFGGFDPVAEISGMGMSV